MQAQIPKVAGIPEIALCYRREIEPISSLNPGIIVYRGEGVLDGRSVALKYYDLSMRDSSLFGQILRNEVRGFGNINFQNAKHIVPYITSGIVETDGNEFAVIVTEFMQGGSLEGRLKKEKSLPIPTVIEYSIQMATGLVELHENQPPTWHLDFRPSNILFDEDGVVKIGDFGTSKLKITPTQGAYPPIQGGTLTSHLAQIRYLSPEQSGQGKKNPIDHKTDIFQLGCVMLDMIGREEDTDPKASPHDIYPAIPEELEAIIEKAHNHSYSQRYDNAREVLYDLVMIGARPVIDGYEKRISDLIGAHPETPLLPAEVEEVGMLLEEYTRHIEDLNLALPYDCQALLQKAAGRFERDYKVIASKYKGSDTSAEPEVTRMMTHRDTIRMINHLRHAHDLFKG